MRYDLKQCGVKVTYTYLPSQTVIERWNQADKKSVEQSWNMNKGRQQQQRIVRVSDLRQFSSLFCGTD